MGEYGDGYKWWNRTKRVDGVCASNSALKCKTRYRNIGKVK